MRSQHQVTGYKAQIFRYILLTKRVPGIPEKRIPPYVIFQVSSSVISTTKCGGGGRIQFIMYVSILSLLNANLSRKINVSHF